MFNIARCWESLRADGSLALRQFRRRKLSAAAAVLSLGLAIGACSAAFRLVDALFLRPMPVRDPAGLYSISYNGFDSRTGDPETWSSNSYPMFRHMRDVLRKEADLAAISYVTKVDLTYGPDSEMEKAYRQSVSGELFSNFGLQPALGRLFTAEEDKTPGSPPYAVLSYDYWAGRFGRDPHVIGRTFHMGGTVYEVVGVSPQGFTGTEPGSMTDLFVPTMMEAGSVNRDNSFWLRIFVRPRPGVRRDALRSRMDALFQKWEKDRAKGFLNFPKYLLDKYPNATLVLKPSGAGASDMQTDYRTGLAALCALAGLVLLVATANVANLMTAQAAARAREMALRLSIGASRWRLVQMVMVESLMLGCAAAALGLAFGWWAAPFVAGQINPPDNPARLVFSVSGELIAFGVALALGVTLLCGFIPALGASGVEPMSTLKGVSEPRSKRMWMNGLIAAQIAFCFVVLVFAGLFATTIERLMKQPTGFSSEHVLLLDTVAQDAQPALRWGELTRRLRAVPGVQAAALGAWPLLSGTMRNYRISVNNSPPSEVLAFFLAVSPGWLDAMQLSLISGRDLRDSDANPGAALVNETFARQYFGGANPVGRSFTTKGPDGVNKNFDIVGLVRDATYRSLREPTLPQAYVPIYQTDTNGAGKAFGDATLVVRTAGADPLAMAHALRQSIGSIDSRFRVSSVRSQTELVQAQTIQERLLANLALFFAGVVLLLAAIGLYGVLNYSVSQRQHEIGIRIAVGAPSGNIARLVTTSVLGMVLGGMAAGLALCSLLTRYVSALLYGVKAGDPVTLLAPGFVLLTVALLAVSPAVMRAVRIDPASLLRSE